MDKVLRSERIGTNSVMNTDHPVVLQLKRTSRTYIVYAVSNGIAGLVDMPLTDIEVNLSDSDGNSMMIIGAVRRALRRGGHADLIDAFTEEAASGDYDNVLRTAMKYVDVS